MTQEKINIQNNFDTSKISWLKSGGNVEKLIKILEKPFENQKNISDYQLPAPLSDSKYQTFCGT